MDYFVLAAMSLEGIRLGFFFFCCTFNEISGFPTRMSKSEKARTKQFECKKKKNSNKRKNQIGI